MKEQVKWIKSQTSGKNVPCEPEIVKIIENGYSSDIYFTPDGEKFHGVRHPKGCIYAYKMKPPSFFEKKNTSYSYR